jgi:hypothetical protein
MAKVLHTNINNSIFHLNKSAIFLLEEGKSQSLVLARQTLLQLDSQPQPN